MDEDWRNIFKILMLPLWAGPAGSGPQGSKIQKNCTNIVMLHIKSKVMKSRIQWFKFFALGARLRVARGHKA